MRLLSTCAMLLLLASPAAAQTFTTGCGWGQRSVFCQSKWLSGPVAVAGQLGLGQVHARDEQHLAQGGDARAHLDDGVVAHVSIADICLVPQLGNAARVNLDMTPYPTIRRIAGECRKLGAFQRAEPQNQPDAEAWGPRPSRRPPLRRGPVGRRAP